MKINTYCINLARRPDRRYATEQECLREGFSPQFIDAIDGAQLDTFPSCAKVSAGEYACGMSHRLAWQHILDSGGPCALVLEDDVRFESGFTESVEAAMRDLNDAWDVLYPGYHYAQVEGVINARACCGRAAATHAYCVTRNVCRDLLREYNPLVVAVDVFLYNHARLRRVLLTPRTAFQRGDDSDISDGRVTDVTTLVPVEHGADMMDVRYVIGTNVSGGKDTP